MSARASSLAESGSKLPHSKETSAETRIVTKVLSETRLGGRAYSRAEHEPKDYRGVILYTALSKSELTYIVPDSDTATPVIIYAGGAPGGASKPIGKFSAITLIEPLARSIDITRFSPTSATMSAPCAFRRKRSPIPKEKDRLFRRKVIGCSGAIGSLGLCRSEATRVIQLWLDFSGLFWAGSRFGFSLLPHGFSLEGDGVGVVDEPV